MKILVIDVGGTHVKVLASSAETRREFASGPSLKPATMVKRVKRLTADWSYDAISIGYPGLVVHGRIGAEPSNLGRGWVGFDFAKAFERPVRIINDAAIQALGSYSGGRMLFLGLGTGLGATLIVEGEVAPMEIAHLPYRKGRTYEEYVGAAGLRRLGLSKWKKHVRAVIALFRAAFEADDVVVGGGNAARLGHMPKGVRLGDNSNVFVGGFRLWTPPGKGATTGAPTQPGETARSPGQRHS